MIKSLFQMVVHHKKYKERKRMEEIEKAQHKQFFDAVEALMTPPFKLEEVKTVFTEGCESWVFLKPTTNAKENADNVKAFFYGADESQHILDRVTKAWHSQFGDAVEEWAIKKALDVAFEASGRALVAVAHKLESPPLTPVE